MYGDPLAWIMARITIDQQVARIMIPALLASAEKGIWNDDLDRILAVCYEVVEE